MSIQPAASVTEPQNIFDNAHFFTGYKALRQHDTGLNGALEVPAMRQQLPSMRDSIILDLGCGFGDFARYARAQGAKQVIAIDISQRMLDDAKRLTDDKAIIYQKEAIEYVSAEAQSFDLVVSSMALHYVADYPKVIRNISRWLKPQGSLVFSVEHPVCTAHPVGIVVDRQDYMTYWPIDNYQQEGLRNTRWFINGVRKYHRTVASYINTLLENGFALDYLGEPAPVVGAVHERPELQIHNRRPPVLLIKAHAI